MTPTPEFKPPLIFIKDHVVDLTYRADIYNRRIRIAKYLITWLNPNKRGWVARFFLYPYLMLLKRYALNAAYRQAEINCMMGYYTTLLKGMKP